MTFEAPGAPAGSRIAVSAGNPPTPRTPVQFGMEKRTIALHEHFGFREEKFVVQLFDASRRDPRRADRPPAPGPPAPDHPDRADRPGRQGARGHGRGPGRDLRLQDGRQSRRRQSHHPVPRHPEAPDPGACAASSWTARR
ncbi:MAG: hypothetical protein MZU91_11175 [Desulfosudis oleivorans]|nr:hypothetical protein [Desulfosudis oleivorans]